MTQPDAGQNLKAGDILVKEGLICPEDVERVLAIQEKNRLAGNRKRLFGMVLCDLNLITPMDNTWALDKYGKLLSLGDFLVKKQVVSPSGLDRLLARATAAGLPFISFLLKKKILEKSLLQQMLFDLFYIPFRSVSDIVPGKKSRGRLVQIIGQTAAQNNLCIPLQVNGASLLVGITDPSNLRFLRELDMGFPQYRFTPVFISFSGFIRFFHLLYGKSWEGAEQPANPSLPMESSMVICDPVADKEKIMGFFHRYEKARKAGQDGAGDERQEHFLEFVRLHHGRMAARSQCRRIRFSLRVQEGRMKILAAPEPGEAG